MAEPTRRTSSVTMSMSVNAPQPPPPFSLEFFGSHPDIVKARKVYTAILVQRTLLIAGVIFGVFSIYWGSLKDLPSHSLKGWVVDFDGAEVGAFISKELSSQSGPTINWAIKPSHMFPNGVEGLQDAILDEQCWIAVAINQGTTKALNESLASGSWNASKAISLFAVEARNENAYRVLLRPTAQDNLDSVTYDFAARWTSELSNANISLNSIPFDTLVQPVSYSLLNLRPFDIPVASAVTFIGLIYLLILAFLIVNSTILARTLAGIDGKLTTRSFIYLRLVTPVTMYFFVTLFYTLLSRAFQLPFERHLGRAGFVVFWMLSWLGMCAVGLALESMVTLLTIKYVQVFLILWIISNVSVSIYPLETLPVVYRYGHVAPFYQISQGVRTIVFGTKNNLGKNFGTLIVWIAVSCITLPIFQYFARRRLIAASRQKEQNEENEKV